MAGPAPQPPRMGRAQVGAVEEAAPARQRAVSVAQAQTAPFTVPEVLVAAPHAMAATVGKAVMARRVS